jgi:hypothetical protein
MVVLNHIVSIEISLKKLVNACSESELQELILLADKRLQKMEYQQNDDNERVLLKS